MKWWVLVDYEAKTIVVGDNFLKDIPNGAKVFDVYLDAECFAEQWARNLSFEVLNETIPF